MDVPVEPGTLHPSTNASAVVPEGLADAGGAAGGTPAEGGVAVEERPVLHTFMVELNSPQDFPPRQGRLMAKLYLESIACLGHRSGALC